MMCWPPCSQTPRRFACRRCAALPSTTQSEVTKIMSSHEVRLFRFVMLAIAMAHMGIVICHTVAMANLSGMVQQCMSKCRGVQNAAEADFGA